MRMELANYNQQVPRLGSLPEEIDDEALPGYVCGIILALGVRTLGSIIDEFKGLGRIFGRQGRKGDYYAREGRD